tara:strand:- start:1402 stop:2430 length:1029 start_codon:yes stop_codon:yes gene_type:complete
MAEYIVLTGEDTLTSRTLLHESIPLTGAIVSGTYSDNNIKNYTHGQFQSVYDYPYLSSSANHIFDLTVGIDDTSTLSSSAATQNAKKINMYNEWGQVLNGFSSSGDSYVVNPFELDLSVDAAGRSLEGFFIPFSRLLVKDEIKKGSFSITLGTGSWASPFGSTIVLQDSNATDTSGFGTCQAGDYAVLIRSGSGGTALGLIYYQAGVAYIHSGAFDGVSDFYSGSWGNYSVAQALVSSSISGSCDAMRHRMQNISFNNSTEINSTIYFCRVPSNKYNYSTNPTYVSGGSIVVKNKASDPAVSYITTVGLYDASNTLLAVAKLSEPLKKDATNELTMRVRLDY